MKKKNRRQFSPLDRLRILHQLHGVVSLLSEPILLRVDQRPPDVDNVLSIWRHRPA